MDVVAWSFEQFQAPPDADLESLSRLVQGKCVSPDEAATLGVARDVVFAVARCERFRRTGDAGRYALPADATNFQSLLLHTLRRLSEEGYRRRGEMCYEPVPVAEVADTQAWRPACTVRDFVVRESRKDVNPEQWRNASNPRDNLETVVRHLVDTDYVEFPHLDADPRLVAWRNGLYQIEHNVFWPYAEREEWAARAAAVGLERREGGWGDAYVLAPPVAVACNFVDRPFGLADGVAEVDVLLARMGLDGTLRTLLFAMLGRLFFGVGERDAWQVMPYLKTSEAADTAALAAVVDPFRHLIGAESVAQVASGGSTTQALSVLAGGRVGAMLLRETMPLEQGDWQSAVSGEEVLVVPPRGRAPYALKWRAPLVGVGPSVSYKNDAGAVDRRVLLFDLSRATADDFRELRVLLLHRVDAFVQLAVAAYLDMANESADRDIWSPGVLPEAMHRARGDFREMICPLHSCLASPLFRRADGLFMPLSALKDLYYDFRRVRGLPTQRWVRDHWIDTFGEFGLTVERSQREYHQGAKTTSDWVLGIDTVDERRELDVSAAQLAQLEADAARLGGELDRVNRRLVLSRELLAVESRICKDKETRNAVRARLREVLDDAQRSDS